MSPHLLAVLVALAVCSPHDRVRERARVIALVTDDPEEQRALAVFDFRETGLGRRGVPFGVTAFWYRERRAGRTPGLEALARVALLNLHRARGVCRDPLRAASWHQSGACRESPYGASVLRLRAVVERAEGYVADGTPAPRAVGRARFEEACLARGQDARGVAPTL